LGGTSGADMRMPADFTEYLIKLATTRARMIFSQLVEDNRFKAKYDEGNYSFLRNNSAYDRCLEIAKKKWKWERKRLLSV